MEKINKILNNIKEAQDNGFYGENYEEAKKQMIDGKKTGHWIWYIFPAFTPIRGSSQKKFDLPNFKSVELYLEDQILRDRMIEMSNIVLGHLNNNKSPVEIFKTSGEIDVYKFYLCMRVFYIVAFINTSKEYHKYTELFKNIINKLENFSDMDNIISNYKGKSKKYLELLIAIKYRDEICK